MSLPKGGGAIKGIDEKFKVNPVNGSANFSIPLPLSPGRNGFTPALGLVYGSGTGNGIFGMGWQLDVPSIQIKRDKALPNYSNKDIYLLSGAEDLVPFVEKDMSGDWNPVSDESNGYKVFAYRPRIEGPHSKIEKIVHADHGVYWKVTTKNNLVTFFGKSESARIYDPDNPLRIFKWFAEFSFDDKGNWIQYGYKKEDMSAVPDRLSEKHRQNGFSKITNRYLKRIKYGNVRAYFPDASTPYAITDPTEVMGLEGGKHCYELVFDYGEHHGEMPSSIEEGGVAWEYRTDAFSSYRAGFEIRTNRLCKRVLMFHTFDELGTTPSLVKSLELHYSPSENRDGGLSETTYLKTAVQSGYIRREDGTYSKKSLPPMSFKYQTLQWDHTVHEVAQDSLGNLPTGLTNGHQWIDLYGEGISGILSEQSRGWSYKQNLGDLDGQGASFGPVHEVIDKPSLLGFSNGTLALQDLEGNGERQWVVKAPGPMGFYDMATQHVAQMEVGPYQPFQSIPNLDWKDSNTRFFDVNGDGRPELVISQENAFLWYENLGKKGYGIGNKIVKSFDGDVGPSMVFSDATESIYLADFSGDGLTDIVQIRNGEVSYWPNLGYGSFGAKVTMDNAPIFDFPDSFNPDYVHLSDVSGTGATDIIYLGQNTCKVYINLSGNGWSDEQDIAPFFPIDNRGNLSVIDLLGTGTSCIVWSTDVPGQHPMRYMDLMGSKKPHMLIGYSNGMGKEVTISYRNSTYFYLKDKREGNPWITKLPFPVQVIEKTTITDHIASAELNTSYRYHHGYYDHGEREFRGFGRVDQIDQESFETYKGEDELDMPPILTKTWIHTGSFTDQGTFSKQYQHEYYTDDALGHTFPDSSIENSDDFSFQELREAVRGLKGTT
ncbi:MAG: SpvB/TcaC N-terminal domain-containing protein, partial [Flavobacteriaceae bacterium]